MIFDHRMHTTIFVLTYNLVLLLVTLSLPSRRPTGWAWLHLRLRCSSHLLPIYPINKSVFASINVGAVTETSPEQFDFGDAAKKTVLVKNRNGALMSRYESAAKPPARSCGFNAPGPATSSGAISTKPEKV